MQAEIDAGRLRVPGVDVDVDRLTVTTGGWQGGAAHLSWEDAGGAWSLTVDDPAALAALTAVLPGAAGEKLREAQEGGRRVRRRGRLTYAVLAAFVLFPVLLLALLFAFREPILDAVVKRLPTSVDAQLGALAVRDLEASGRKVADGPVVDAVRAVGTRLVAAAPAEGHAFRFEVVRDPTLNAYAAPGGLVVVHTGLVAAASSEHELAGVLAHEVVHVLHRHSMRQVVFQAGLATGLRLLLGSAEGAAESLAGAAAQLSSLRFSRDQERDADAAGLDLLQRARLPGDGLPTFFERLAKEGGAPPALLSSHPASEERAAAARAELARRGSWPVEPLPIDWAAVRAAAAAPK